MALRLITAQEFRSSRYADVADQVDNIEDIIEEAEAHIEHLIDRRIKSEQYTELHRPSADRIFVRQRPIISLDTVQRRADHDDAWEALDTADFEVEPAGAAGVILDLEGDDIAGYEVQVVYTAGYATTPTDVRAAVILQTALFAFTDLEVFGASDAKEPAIAHLQRQVDRLLKPYTKARLR